MFIGGTGTLIASINALVHVVFLCDCLIFVIQPDLIESFIVDIVDVRVEFTPGIIVLS